MNVSVDDLLDKIDSKYFESYMRAVSSGMPSHWEFVPSTTVRALNCLSNHKVDPKNNKKVFNFLKTYNKNEIRNLGKKTFIYLLNQIKQEKTNAS